MTLPSLDLLVADLRQVVKHGVGAISDDVELRTLAELLLVEHQRPGANQLDTIIAIERSIRQAIATLEGTPPHQVLELLFGMTPATMGALAKQRRQAAAAQSRTDPGTFNRHDEQRLLRLLARRLYELEADAQLRAARLGPPPPRGELRASWQQRFVHYHRIQGILRQLRLDLIAVLLTFTTVQDATGREDYLDASIWQYARFLAAHDRFGAELGGVWFMPEPAADAGARLATELALWHGPFNERGRSWLRAALAQVPNGELDPFARRLRDGPDGAELLGLWESWLEDCRCDPDHPDESCRPHRVIDACERFVALVDEQWADVREVLRDLRSKTDVYRTPTNN